MSSSSGLRLKSAGRSRLSPAGAGAIRATTRQREGLCVPPQTPARKVRWGWVAVHSAAWAEGVAMILLGDVAGLVPIVISGSFLAKEFPWRKLL